MVTSARARRERTAGRCPSHPSGCKKPKLPFGWDYFLEHGRHLDEGLFRSDLECITNARHWADYQEAIKRPPKSYLVDSCSVTKQCFRPERWLAAPGGEVWTLEDNYPELEVMRHWPDVRVRHNGFVKKCVFCDSTRGEARRARDEVQEAIWEQEENDYLDAYGGVEEPIDFASGYMEALARQMQRRWQDFIERQPIEYQEDKFEYQEKLLPEVDVVAECPICYETVDCATAVCRHSFCLVCLSQVFQHGLKCPMCREPLDYSASRALGPFEERDIAQAAETPRIEPTTQELSWRLSAGWTGRGESGKKYRYHKVKQHQLNTTASTWTFTVPSELQERPARKQRGGRRNWAKQEGYCYLKTVPHKLKPDAKQELGWRPQLQAYYDYCDRFQLMPRNYKLVFCGLVGTHFARALRWPAALQRKLIGSMAEMRYVGAEDWSGWEEHVVQEVFYNYPHDAWADECDIAPVAEVREPERVPTKVGGAGYCWQKLSPAVRNEEGVMKTAAWVAEQLEECNDCVMDLGAMAVKWSRQDDGDLHIDDAAFCDLMYRDTYDASEPLPDGYQDGHAFLAFLRDNLTRVVGAPATPAIDRAITSFMAPDIRSALERNLQGVARNGIDEMLRLCPWAIPEVNQQYAVERNIPWSRTATVPHPHPIHAYERRKMYQDEIPKFIKCDTTFVNMKVEHFNSVKTAVEALHGVGTYNLKLVNVINDLKDTGRFSGQGNVAPDVFELPVVDTPGVHFDECGHYLTPAIFAQLHILCPAVRVVTMTNIFPLLSLEFNQSPNPSYVNWRIVEGKRGKILVYIPEGDEGGKYEQPYDPTMTLLSCVKVGQKVCWNGGVLAKHGNNRLQAFYKYHLAVPEVIVESEFAYMSLPKLFRNQREDIAPIRVEQYVKMFQYSKALVTASAKDQWGKLRQFIQEQKIYFPPADQEWLIKVVLEAAKVVTVADVSSRVYDSLSGEVYYKTVGWLAAKVQKRFRVRYANRNARLINHKDHLRVFPTITAHVSMSADASMFSTKWSFDAVPDANLWQSFKSWLISMFGHLVKSPSKADFSVRYQGNHVIFPLLCNTAYNRRCYGLRMVKQSQVRDWRRVFENENTVRYQQTTTYVPARRLPPLNRQFYPYPPLPPRPPGHPLAPVPEGQEEEGAATEPSEGSETAVGSDDGSIKGKKMFDPDEFDRVSLADSFYETEQEYQDRVIKTQVTGTTVVEVEDVKYVDEVTQERVSPLDRYQPPKLLVCCPLCPTQSEFLAKTGVRDDATYRGFTEELHHMRKRNEGNLRANREDEWLLWQVYLAREAPPTRPRKVERRGDEELQEAKKAEQTVVNATVMEPPYYAKGPEDDKEVKTWKKNRDEFDKCMKARPTVPTKTQDNVGETLWDSMYPQTVNKRYAKIPYRDVVEYPRLEYPEQDCLLTAMSKAMGVSPAKILFYASRAYPRHALHNQKVLDMVVLHPIALHYGLKVVVKHKGKGHHIATYGVKDAHFTVELLYDGKHLEAGKQRVPLMIQQPRRLLYDKTSSALLSRLDFWSALEWVPWEPEKKRATDYVRALREGTTGLIGHALNQEKLEEWMSACDNGPASGAPKSMAVVLGDPGCRKSSTPQRIFRQKQYQKLGNFMVVLPTSDLAQDWRNKLDAPSDVGGPPMPGDMVVTFERALARGMHAKLVVTDENKFPKGYTALFHILNPLPTHHLWLADPWQTSWHEPNQECQLNDPNIPGEAELYMKYAKFYLVGTYRYAGPTANFWRQPSWNKQHCAWAFADSLPTDWVVLRTHFPTLSDATLMTLWKDKHEFYAAHFDTVWASQLRATETNSFAGSQGLSVGLAIIEIDEKVLRSDDHRLLYTAMTRSRYILFCRKWRHNGRSEAYVQAHPVLRELEYYREKYQPGKPVIIEPEHTVSIREIMPLGLPKMKFVLAGIPDKMVNRAFVQPWLDRDGITEFIDPDAKMAGARLSRYEEAYKDNSIFLPFISEVEEPHPPEPHVREPTSLDAAPRTSVPMGDREGFVEFHNQQVGERYGHELMLKEYSQQLPDTYQRRKDAVARMREFVDKQPGKSRAVRWRKANAKLKRMPDSENPTLYKDTMTNWGLMQRASDDVTHLAARQQRINFSSLEANNQQLKDQKELGDACWTAYKRYLGWEKPVPFDENYYHACIEEFQFRRGDRSQAMKKGSLNRADPDFQMFMSVKTQWKLKDREFSSAKPGQPVMVHSDKYIFEHGPYGIYMLNKFLEHCPSYFHFHATKTPQDLAAWVANNLYPGEELEMNDQKGQDQAVQGWAVVLLTHMMRWFGLPETFIDSFEHDKLSKELHHKIMAIMTDSGEIWTFFGNTVSSTARECLMFGLQPGDPMAGGGDDIMRRPRGGLTDQYLQVAHLDPSIDKRYRSTRGDFVSFIVQKGHLFKDPIILLKRFLGKLAMGEGELAVQGYHHLWAFNYAQRDLCMECMTEEELEAHSILTRIMYNLKREGIKTHVNWELLRPDGEVRDITLEQAVERVEQLNFSPQASNTQHDLSSQTAAYNWLVGWDYTSTW